MTITFRTESGSVYELDEANKKIRRMTGVKPGTSRQNADGEWQTYQQIWASLKNVGSDEAKIQVGLPVLIVWRIEDGVNKSTLTSKVVEALIL